jgi:hypothetical protein
MDDQRISSKARTELINEIKQKRVIDIEIQKRKQLLESDEKRNILSNEKRQMTFQVFESDEVKLDVQIKGKKKLKPSSFEIMQPLGAGAFGQVWLVMNKNNGEIMAMKVIDKERLMKDDLMSYAKTEKNIMRQIKHPFIIALKHSFQTPEKFFLIMEY